MQRNCNPYTERDKSHEKTAHRFISLRRCRRVNISSANHPAAAQGATPTTAAPTAISSDHGTDCRIRETGGHRAAIRY